MKTEFNFAVGHSCFGLIEIMQPISGRSLLHDNIQKNFTMTVILAALFRACQIVSIGVWMALLAVVSTGTAQDKPVEKFSQEKLEFFENKIRPLLVKHCYECHGPDSDFEGGLSLVSRKSILEGGDSGPAINLKQPEKSILMNAVNYGDLFEMPPDSKLPQKEIDLLKKWVDWGAPWPDEKVEAQAKAEAFNLEKRIAEHWCWQPIKRYPLPKVTKSQWPIEPLDHFVLKKLEEKGLTPQKPADRATWIRRAYFDLIGLPPTASEIQTFVDDSSDDAFDKVVDKLLASPHFGERWARHWMDLVRYAETCGHEFDYPLPYAHQYRDYLIRAFNADVRYDQFLREHIAGDLIKKPRRHNTEKYNESILGTGFWFLGEATHGPVDSKADEAGRIDNQIDVMSKTFLGLTIACARCHDHKFDAISTADYYALSGFLQSSRRQDTMLDRNQEIKKSSDQAKTLLGGTDRWLKQVREKDLLASQSAPLASYLQAAIQFSQSNRRWRSKNNLVFQGESLDIVKRTGGETLVQHLKPKKNFKLQGDKQIWWFNGKVGDQLVFKFNVYNKGKYQVSANFVKAVDYGIAEIYIDGKLQKKFDFYSKNITATGLVEIGQPVLDAGEHQLSFKIVGFNPKAVEKYMVGLDYLQAKLIEGSQPDTKPVSVEELVKQYDLDRSKLERWIKWVEDEANAQTDHPLYPIFKAINHVGELNEDFFATLQRELKDRHQRAKDSRKDAVKFADFENGGDGWFQTGFGFDPQPMDQVGVDLSQPSQIGLTGTWSSGRKGKRFYGVLRSPTFKITHRQVHYRMNSENVRVRLIVDGFTMDIYNSLLYNGLTFNFSSGGRFKWRSQGGDLRNHLGKNAHIEIIDHGQGFAAIDEIYFSDGAAPADFPSKLAQDVVAGSGPLTLKSFCQRLSDQIAECLKDGKSRDHGQLIGGIRRHNIASLNEFANSKISNVSTRASIGSNSPKGTAVEASFDKLIEQLIANNKKVPAPFFAVGITDGTGEDEFVFVRGNHKNLGAAAPRRLITALQSKSIEKLTPRDGSGRLGLADKMVSDNPLTTRVITNRLWHHMFGRGIVPSVDNFGVLGESPTHPELLDFLATQFVADHWSIKKTLKRMVLSQTYRMASGASAAAREQDPDNKWLSHAPRRRLQGEAIRDSMLKISAELDPKLYGKSVRVHVTEFMQGRGRPGGKDYGPLDGDRRRSVYIESRRNFLPPMMLAFDTPVPFNTIGRRTVSNVPAQALILMNDPFVLLQAEKWAERLIAVEETIEQRIDRIYVAAFARKPNEFERTKSRAFLIAQAGEYSVAEKDIMTNKQVWTDFCHVIFNVKEFIFIR